MNYPVHDAKYVTVTKYVVLVLLKQIRAVTIFQ